MKKPDIIGMIVEQVEMEAQDEWRPPRVVGAFRGSELGDCPRSIQYATLGKVPERPAAPLALIFRDGHLHHDSLRGLLKRIGRVTNEEFSGWKEYSVKVNERVATFKLTATTDGIFNGEFVFDIKSINPWSFKKLSIEYIEEKYERYIMQLQTYLDIFDKEWGFLFFKDKGFGGLKVFWFKRDQEWFQRRVLNRMAKIHLATLNSKMIKRPFTKSSDECKGCFFRIHCWNKPMEKRSWR